MCTTLHIQKKSRLRRTYDTTKISYKYLTSSAVAQYKCAFSRDHNQVHFRAALQYESVVNRSTKASAEGAKIHL